MSQPLAILAPSSLAVALLRDDMEEALGFAAQEKATATRAAYQSDFRI